MCKELGGLKKCIYEYWTNGTQTLVRDTKCWGFPGGAEVKNLPAIQETQEIQVYLWVGKIPCSRNGNPFQDSCLENSMDRVAWWATVHGVTNSWTGLSLCGCVCPCMCVHMRAHRHTHTQCRHENRTIRQFRIVSVPNVYGVAAASWSVGIAIPSSLLSRWVMSDSVTLSVGFFRQEY